MGKEPERHRSLADQLRSWPEEDLLRLLTDRPDLATPAPSDFGHLASRATAQSSIARALDILSRGELLVLDALVLAGQTTDEEIREGQSGNFCRCTGYQGIVNAVHQAAEAGAETGAAAP